MYQVETKTDNSGGTYEHPIVLSEHDDMEEALEALANNNRYRGCWVRRGVDAATLIPDSGPWILPSGEEAGEEDYESEYPEELPDGWELAVYKDGRALVCSPGTCPRELGGYELASASREDALFEVRDLIRSI